MSDDRDLLDQADRLMRRHRIFVAGAAAAAPIEDDAFDDLPVLTDVVPEVEEVVVPPPPPPGPSIDEQAQVLAHELLLERLSAQRNAIEKEVVAWLDKELPEIVMYVIDGITDQLVAQVTAAMRLELLPKLQLAVEAEEEGQASQDGVSS